MERLQNVDSSMTAALASADLRLDFLSTRPSSPFKPKFAFKPHTRLKMLCQKHSSSPLLNMRRSNESNESSSWQVQRKPLSWKEINETVWCALALAPWKHRTRETVFFQTLPFNTQKGSALADASRLCDKLSPWWRVWPPGADRTRTEQTYDVFVHKQAASSSIVSVTRLVWHFVWHWRRESLAPVTTWQWQVWLGIGFKSCVFICFLF